MITYFVSYTYQDGDGQGFGNTTVEIEGRILNEADVRIVEQAIEIELTKEPGRPVKVILLNYRRMEAEPSGGTAA